MIDEVRSNRSGGFLGTLGGMLGRRRHRSVDVAIIVVVALVVVRAAAPYVIEAVLDDALGNLPDHWGAVQDVDLELYRGRYTIEDLNILERNMGADARPLLSIERAHIGLDWSALFHGRIDAQVELDDARFSIVKNARAIQTGDSPALREMLLAIVPLEISRCEITNGRVRFVDETTNPHVNLDIRDVHLVAHGLSTRPSADDEIGALPARIDVRGAVLGRAPLSVTIAMNTFAEPHPRFDLELELEDLALEALNDATNAYGGFDFEDGTVAFYAEVAGADGKIEGYAKPLIGNAEVVDTDGNDADDNVVEVVWESFVAAAATVLENPSTRRVATQIPIEGRFDDPHVGTFRTVVNLVGNAFFSAISPRPDHTISIETVLEAAPRSPT